MKAPTPILPGFNPDPSIVRVGADYYIATSTFEWFPGVRIYHSTDLANWQLVAQPLNRVNQLDMRGVPDSCGVWAPCLSYAKGTFYLVFSNVKTFDGPWLDTPNYLVTTEDITGDWSDPIALSASGFDGSLFHDSDGKKWYVSMLHDGREGKFFGGIILQEYDPLQKKLVGPVHQIFAGSSLGKTEGPHLYHVNGYYYLITAEGGTEYGHAVTLARSKSIFGPYELHPDNPLLTSVETPEHPLQKPGHADLVSSENGKWYMTYLVGRPLTKLGRCVLGRETSIQQVTWQNGWPHPENLKKTPEYRYPPPAQKIHYDFRELLDSDFQSLREPMDHSWIRQDGMHGLTLLGRNSLSSLFHQSLIARRLQHINVDVTTLLCFHPSSFQQMAGLVFYYNTSHYHYLYVTGSSEGTPVLQVISNDKNEISESLPVTLNTSNLLLRGSLRGAKLQFYFGFDGINWQRIGEVLDGSILSDDYVREGHVYRPAFTGCMVGIACQDLSGHKRPATFTWLDYQEFHT